MGGGKVTSNLNSATHVVALFLPSCHTNYEDEIQSRWVICSLAICHVEYLLFITYIWFERKMWILMICISCIIYSLTLLFWVSFGVGVLQLCSFTSVERKLLGRKRLHIINSKWLEDCLNSCQRLSEDTYSIKPYGIEESTSEDW